ncbi:MAG: PaaI family thioesterase [Pseudomonadota bacterium]
MDFPVHIPFVELLGLELLSMGDGRAELRLPPRPEHQNSFHIPHGGVVMTVLDVVMAHAARSLNVDGQGQQHGVVTIEMKTSFMKAGSGVLTARGEVLHRTATLAFCDGRLVDASGACCAQATGTFKFLRGMAARDSDGRRLVHAPRPPAALSGDGSD